MAITTFDVFFKEQGLIQTRKVQIDFSNEIDPQIINVRMEQMCNQNIDQWVSFRYLLNKRYHQVDNVNVSSLLLTSEQQEKLDQYTDLNSGEKT